MVVNAYNPQRVAENHEFKDNLGHIERLFQRNSYSVELRKGGRLHGRGSLSGCTDREASGKDKYIISLRG